MDLFLSKTRKKKWADALLFIFLVFISPSICLTQNLLNLPESIIYDESHHRYLISNYNTGDIIQVDSTGHQSYFVQNANAIQGLEISGNVIYVGAGQMVRGFNLETGQMVMDVHVPDVSNLNDVTADTSGNVYASDVFSTKIIKIKISTGAYSVFVNGQGINQPNGIFFDKEYNRILVCSYRTNSPIQAINLADSTVSTIVNSNISLCDGIVKDRYGNCYVTSWSTYSIYKYDSLFANQPVLVYTNSCGPADISYDNVHNVIAIPLMACNSWTTFPVVIGIENNHGEVPDRYLLYQNYPNPFNPVTKIKFDVPASNLTLSGAEGSAPKGHHIQLVIYDAIGREITVLANELLKPGTYEVSWDASIYPSGIYFCRLEAGDYISGRKMMLIK